MDKINIEWLARALDKLKACADGKDRSLRLTQGDCKDVCAYIWWLTDQIHKAKTEKPEEN